MTTLDEVVVLLLVLALFLLLVLGLERQDAVGEIEVDVFLVDAGQLGSDLETMLGLGDVDPRGRSRFAEAVGNQLQPGHSRRIGRTSDPSGAGIAANGSFSPVRAGVDGRPNGINERMSTVLLLDLCPSEQRRLLRSAHVLSTVGY